MKIRFPISDCQLPIEKKTVRPPAGNWQLAIGNRQTQSAVALVITVILLAVVTLMAVAFLAMSRQERNSVTTSTDTVTARLAADDALASAEAQIVANTLATTNPYNFGLLVSTNYINRAGFNPAITTYDPTNVNYSYYSTGPGPLSEQDFLQNLANLYYLPRPPVFYQTNTDPNYPLDFRYYLDLNRNGLAETNGWVPEIAANGQYIHQDGSIGPSDVNVLTNYHVGDPDWIGVLQHPDQPYGPNNPFVARYAFVALPIGNALDLNHIFNQVMDMSSGPTQDKSVIVNGLGSPLGVGNDGFVRNQGVGSWEINLAAFLADLNTNQWLPSVPPNPTYYWYQYRDTYPYQNQGRAFDDARALLAYRYDNNYLTLKRANLLFPLNQANLILPNDNIDEYSDGPLQTTPAPIDEALNRDEPGLSWAGAPNTNHFFSMQDLFDPSKANMGAASALNSFTNHLLTANNGLSTYDRYTYYRMLSQMGVDSAPELDQINLNYSNAAAYFDPVTHVPTKIVYYPNAETNLTPWQPLQFFTIAADRMLRAYSQEWITENPSNYLATYGVFTNISTAADPIADPTNVPITFGITNIPVYVDGHFVYTPAVQRVLQLAANIYDATTNTATATTPDYPSVFRPIFNVVPVQSPVGGIIYTNVYIAGYEPVGYNGQNGTVPGGTNNYQLALPFTLPGLFTLNPDVSDSPYPSPFGIYTNVNVYGVPWIIGAKKGFPNFNEFAMESTFQLTRKLQVTREYTNDTYVMHPDHYHFNQMFNLNLTNQLAVECWNSYTNFYQYPNGQPRHVTMYVDDLLSVTLTNDEYPFSYTTNFFITSSLQIPNPSLTAWAGYNPTVFPLSTPASFQIPLNVNVPVIPTSMYRFNVPGNIEQPGHFGPYLVPTNLDYPWGNSLFESSANVQSRFGQPYPQPHWWLMTSNNVRVIILDTTDPGPPQVVDYVQLRGPDSVRDLTSEIMHNYDVPFNATEPSGDEMWNTNIINGVPIGILSQFGVAEGNYTPGPASGTWDTTDPTLQGYEIAGFLAFLGYSPQSQNSVEAQYIALGQTSLSNQAPYSPVGTVIQIADWQANDPLVHYLAQDLDQPGIEPSFRPPIPPTPAPTLSNSTYATIGKLNTRYMPWGGYPDTTNTADFNGQNEYNMALKDPLVWQSDDWDFPTYKMPTVGWLGRVHRGTPWQTVYLKSPDILREMQVKPGGTDYGYGTNTWKTWTGDNLLTSGQYYDAANTAPAQDRLLFDLFSTAPDANATRGTLSVNVGASNTNDLQAGLAAWSALFSGVQVLSNSAANPLNQHNGSMLDYTSFPINPAGPAGANSDIGKIVAGINRLRINADNSARIVWINKTSTTTNEIPAHFANASGVPDAFEHVGDILSVPQLTDESPFLNWNNLTQLHGGISDELYEWLPQQVMSLLRVSGTPQSPMRYVIYSYGQALKPAPNGIYTGGGQYFGMVTNYQVVAESATRTVVNFGSVLTNVVAVTNDLSGKQILFSVPVVTNNDAQIEQFNMLPPN